MNIPVELNINNKAEQRSHGPHESVGEIWNVDEEFQIGEKPEQKGLKKSCEGVMFVKSLEFN